MPNGTVKWFDETKGYGFITSEDGGDIFVHYSSIQDGGFKSLVEGDSVSFEVEQGEKRAQGSKCRKTLMTSKSISSS